MIAIKGIDYEEMRSRLMCDDDTCRTILETFCQDVSQKLSAIMEEKDEERFVTLAHGIKGSCANISATECFERARELEMKARADGRAESNQELARLYVKLHALLDEISKFLNDTDDALFV